MSFISIEAKAKHIELNGEERSLIAKVGNQLFTLADVQSIPDGKQLCAHALVVRSEIALDRKGHKYLMLTLRGTDGGVIEARWWHYPYPTERRPQVGIVYECEGTLETYKGERQVRLTEIRSSPCVDITPFVASTRRSLDELQADFNALLKATSPEISVLIRAVLSGEVYSRFCMWPAAQRHHGAVKHGLFAHSLRVAHIACLLADAYGPDGLSCDRDLVIAASLLHDVGKIRTLPAVAGAALPEEAQTIDHVTVSLLMVSDIAQTVRPRLTPVRLQHLLHLILAHHGRKEWGAVVEPYTVDAWIVHLADLAESRLWAYSKEEKTTTVQLLPKLVEEGV